MIIEKKEALRGELCVPGDKSISHRSVMFGALADGKTEAENFLTGADCLSTIACFRKMGIEIEQNGTSVKINGKGLHGLTRPNKEDARCRKQRHDRTPSFPALFFPVSLLTVC